MELLKVSSLPIFQKSKRVNNNVNFNLAAAIEDISANREEIPDRYWDVEKGVQILPICQEEQTIGTMGTDTLTTDFIMKGRKGDVCSIHVHSSGYSDTHECGGQDFGAYITQIQLGKAEVKKLKELYILSKKNVTLPDLIHCENMEIRRDAIKKMGFDMVKEHAVLIDSEREYDLFDLRFGGEDFGRFLKMVDATSNEVYLLQVPRTRDFGTIKIKMDKAMQAVAWSFDKQLHNYSPSEET